MQRHSLHFFFFLKPIRGAFSWKLFDLLMSFGIQGGINYTALTASKLWPPSV